MTQIIQYTNKTQKARKIDFTILKGCCIVTSGQCWNDNDTDNAHAFYTVTDQSLNTFGKVGEMRSRTGRIPLLVAVPHFEGRAAADGF